MLPYIAEFLGTCMLIFLGNSSIANATFDKSGHKGAGVLQINIAWGLAVMIPAFIFGDISGAHFNPALTIAFAIDHTISWKLVPGYIICQMAGGFLGACLVYVFFKDQFDATKEASVKLAAFCTTPAVQNIPQNILQEAMVTFFLIFSIKGVGQIVGLVGGLKYVYIFGIIMATGMCFGGVTGAALNPARDLAPRLAHTLLPIENKGDSNFKYGCIVPVVGPLIGAIAAVKLYAVMFN